jgi:hypothetical protein
MGWKALRDHYNISHVVSINNSDEICIGSEFIPDLIRLDFDGEIISPEYEEYLSTKELNRYLNDFREDPVKLAEILGMDDTFDKSIPVYTHREGQVLTYYCEKLGWPNVTHFGELMHPYRYFVTEAEATAAAKVETEIKIKMCQKSILQYKEALEEQLEILEELEEQMIELHDVPAQLGLIEA